MAKSTLPVDLRGSKTSQLKLPNYSMLERFWLGQSVSFVLI